MALVPFELIPIHYFGKIENVSYRYFGKIENFQRNILVRLKRWQTMPTAIPTSPMLPNKVEEDIALICERSWLLDFFTRKKLHYPELVYFASVHFSFVQKGPQ